MNREGVKGNFRYALEQICTQGRAEEVDESNFRDKSPVCISEVF